MTFSEYIRINSLKMKTRTREYVIVRQLLFWTIKNKYPLMTYEGIGAMFDLHHATVIYGIRKIDEYKAFKDKELEVYQSKFKEIEHLKL